MSQNSQLVNVDESQAKILMEAIMTLNKMGEGLLDDLQFNSYSPNKLGLYIESINYTVDQLLK